MPPLPSLPDRINVREVYNEGSYRLDALVAAAEVESQCLGYSTLVWYANEGQPKPQASDEKQQERIEFQAYLGTYHYECTIVAGGTIAYSGDRAPDHIAVSMGTKFKGNNTMEMPAHPSTIVKSSVGDLDTANWMGALRKHHPGTTKLSDLTIPGTHNSFARVGLVENVFLIGDFVSEFAECQTYPIIKQLEMGIRSIDLRTSGSDLLLRHGRIGLNGDLRTALDEIASFLNFHPDETVLVQAKRDMEDLLTGARSPETSETRKAVEDCFTSYACSYTSTTVPTLDEARGKMILLSSEYAKKGISLSPTRDGTPQVNWSYQDFEQHWAAVSTRLAFNANHPVSDADASWYTCGTGSYWFPESDGKDEAEKTAKKLKAIQYHDYKSPREFAMYTNWRLSELVRGKFWDKKTRLGVVEVDFAYPALVKELVLTNF